MNEEELLKLADAAKEATGILACTLGIETCFANWCDLGIVLELDEPWNLNYKEDYAHWGKSTHPDYPFCYGGSLYTNPVNSLGFTSCLVDHKDGGDPSWMVFKDSNREYKIW